MTKKLLLSILLFTMGIAPNVTAHAKISGKGALSPGIAIAQKIPGGVTYCSAGFLAEKNGQHYMFTAGHCVKNMKAPVYGYINNKWYKIGKYVAYIHNPFDDIALAKIDPRVPINSHVFYSRVLSGVVHNRDILNRTHPKTCKFGETSGLSCGRLTRINSHYASVQTRGGHGDSGCPVYYYDPQQGWIALGILVRGTTSGIPRIDAQEINTYLKNYNLTLLG